MTTGRIFWVKFGDDDELPLKFDFDEDALAGGHAYPTPESYLAGLTKWDVPVKYAVQDVEPDETTTWLDGPSCP